ALAPFRFSIAMENASSNLYFTEKLVDCLLLETIPIYYGCPAIDSLFDPRGMLIFRNLTELEAHCNALSPELYNSMRPFALANKERVIAEHWHAHSGMLARLAIELGSRAIPRTAVRPLWRYRLRNAALTAIRALR
ncbi:MAG: hypothetical protein ACK5Q5_12315, partial [Planctomycetaceae bacterium]